MAYGVVLVVPLLLDVAVEMHLDGVLIDFLHPYLAARQPEVRQLGLPALDELLAEDAVLVAQRVAHCRVALRGEAVEEACREAAEAAVAEAGVRLLLIECVELRTHIGERLAEVFLKAEVEEVVFQGAPEQELHAEVVDLLCVALFRVADEFVSAAHQKIAHNKGGRLVKFLVAGVFRGDAVDVRELFLDRRFYLRDRHAVIHVVPPKLLQT